MGNRSVRCVLMSQELRLFEDHDVRLGNGEQGKLQAGRQREGTGGTAEERGVEGSKGD